MSDVLPPLPTRIHRLEVTVQTLLRDIDSLRRARDPQLILPEQPRLAVTCDPSSGSYPTANANCFPLKFVDAYFTATAGQQTLTKANRQAAQAVIALFPTGNWIPNGTVVSVYQCRGLGGEDDGDWFILDGPRAYWGRLTGAFAQGTSGTAEVFQNNDSSSTLLATLNVKAGPLFNSDTEISDETWVHFSWDVIQSYFLIDGSACSPEE
jgi:hypothetical protein